MDSSTSGNFNLSVEGRNVLWGVFAWMTLSSVAFGIQAVRVPEHKRTYHYVTLAITTIAALAYYAMANSEGVAVVGPVGEERPIFYARYIDWVFTTPLLLVDLGLVAGLPIDRIVSIAFLDVLMVVTGLFGSLDSTSTKWGWFAMGCIFFLPIVYTLTVEAYEVAVRKSSVHKDVYSTLSVLTIVLWTAYPIVWALAEGSNILSSDVEIIVYAVLDIAAKSVFGFYLLANHERLDAAEYRPPTLP